MATNAPMDMRVARLLGYAIARGRPAIWRVDGTDLVEWDLALGHLFSAWRELVATPHDLDELDDFLIV